jgi:antitoxin CptB
MTSPPHADAQPAHDEIRRKRIKIRAWRRGMRELDILIGGFVDVRLEMLTHAEIDALEELLNLPDTQLLSWLCGGSLPPPEYDCDILHQIIAFHTHSGPIH